MTDAPGLLASEAEVFRRIVDSVRDYAIFLLDARGYVRTWNRGAQEIKGYQASEIIGKHFSTFYPAEANERRWPERELAEASRVGRFEDNGWRVRKDGSQFWANVVITAIHDDNGLVQGFSKVTRDLTERRSEEERLRQSEERFRLLVDNVRDYAIFMLDPSGHVVTWNAGAQRLKGYKAVEIVGRHFSIFYPPEALASDWPAQELREAAALGRFEDEGWRLRKDGTRFWANVVITALRGPDGALRGFGKLTRDLSERKRMEDLEAQGRHLTEFIAMLAHELRNPLAPIRNALGILQMHRDLPPRVTWSSGIIERQVTHLTRLVDDLLDVSRITRGKLRMRLEDLDLHLVVQRAIESARPQVDAGRHRLHVNAAAEPLAVHGDAARLTQVILNLLDNAARYTEEGGDIWLESGRGDGEVFVRVRDNGAGIPAPMMESIFDLFAQGERTIDRSPGGLGIGLTLARRIVTLHGGTITARSEGPGRGSEFEVRLPCPRAREVDS